MEMNTDQFLEHCEGMAGGITYLTADEMIRLYFIAEKNHDIKPGSDSVGMFRVDFMQLLNCAKSKWRDKSKQLDFFDK